MRKTIFLLLSLLLLGGGAVGVKLWAGYTQPGPLTQDTDVVIPQGNYRSTIHTLQSAHVLPSGMVAEYIALLAIQLTRHQGQLHAAELSFPANSSLKQVLWILRHAHPVLHKLTIPEGLSAYQIQEIFENAAFLTGQTPLPEEGSVQPQTYKFLRNTMRSNALASTQTAMAHTLESLWQNREVISEIPNKHALVTLASLIEKETSVPEERPEVARVFINRLNAGIKLQTDPTVIYGLTAGKTPLGHGLTHAELQNASAYNTYLYAGLPPGPICSPGLSALQAAAHPAKGDMLYFVANGRGGHNFANTLAEHNKNVSEFRKTLKK
ncbi:endolytic transglycosylase MltG [Acetobacter orientalis]|uniref:endolytic transglycosylase MltG n=1 Tax=Acetobacter orientalis TaxID=146474 RepID=UPI0039ECB273